MYNTIYSINSRLIFVVLYKGDKRYGLRNHDIYWEKTRDLQTLEIQWKCPKPCGNSVEMSKTLEIVNFQQIQFT